MRAAAHPRVPAATFRLLAMLAVGFLSLWRLTSLSGLCALRVAFLLKLLRQLRPEWIGFPLIAHRTLLDFD